MGFSWIPKQDGNQDHVDREVYQELVDNIKQLEDRVKAGCDSLSMSTSGRRMDTALGHQDPLRRFSWRANTEPDFEREYVEAADLEHLRDAIDPLWDNRNNCRAFFSSDFQNHRGSLRTTDHGTFEGSRDNHCGTNFTGHDNNCTGRRFNDRDRSRHDGGHRNQNRNDHRDLRMH